MIKLIAGPRAPEQCSNALWAARQAGAKHVVRMKATRSIESWTALGAIVAGGRRFYRTGILVSFLLAGCTS
jgi:hypothetical protein